jgi:NAD(P)H-quinone oxidoreductase subunit 5
VSLVVVTDHLAVLTAAWMGASLALHRLLLFFGARPAARVAAHKKFLFSRLADLSMAAGAALLGAAFGTLSIGDLLSQAGAAADCRRWRRQAWCWWWSRRCSSARSCPSTAG